MPLLNYTTTVATAKTAAAVQHLLAKAGARSITTQYDGGGRMVGLSFVAETSGGFQEFTLPVDAAPVLEVLRRQQVPRKYVTPDQAERVAWRIAEDWVKAQLAIIETGMVSLVQVMLPYMVAAPDGATVFEVYDRQRQLGPAAGEVARG